MPYAPACLAHECLTRLQTKIDALLREFDEKPVTPQQVVALEREVHAYFRHAADECFGAQLQVLVERVRGEALERAREVGAVSRGRVRVPVRLLGGSTMHLHTSAVRRAPKKTGRKRGSGKRRRGVGMASTPALQALGFVSHCTPALGAEVVHAVSACESFASANMQLARRGIELGVASLHRLTAQLAEAMRQARDAWLSGGADGAPAGLPSCAGRRIVVCFDGGRLRQRVDKSLRKKANGYRDYTTDWVEPRQLVIYAIDDSGKLAPSFGRVADATLGGAEEVMTMLGNYLKQLRICEAEEVIIAADGQRWQWARLVKLLEDLGVQTARITQVLDKCHAVSRLYELAELPRWTQARRVRWQLKARKLLDEGDLDGLIREGLALAKGRRAKTVKQLVGYFQHHRQRMDYKSFKSRGIPTGSGVVESMLRQVVNMRLKATGKFWRRENAERMLMLRSWLKSRRLERLYAFSINFHTHNFQSLAA